MKNEKNKNCKICKEDVSMERYLIKSSADGIMSDLYHSDCFYLEKEIIREKNGY